MHDKLNFTAIKKIGDFHIFYVKFTDKRSLMSTYSRGKKVWISYLTRHGCCVTALSGGALL
jgi:hypothetical protein